MASNKDFFVSYSPEQIEQGSERLLRVVVKITDQIRLKLKQIDIELNGLLVWVSKSKVLDEKTRTNVLKAAKKMRKIGNAALRELEKSTNGR